MAHWSGKYFGNLYHEIYSRYLLDPQRAVEEAAFAAQVLDLGRRKVLDLACGFGRHARLLAASNRVVALDNNFEYLAGMHDDLMERASNNLLPVQGDMRDIPLADRSIDAAIMLFNSFGYFDADDDDSDEANAVKSASRQVWKLPNVFYERDLVDPSFGKFRDPVVQPETDNTAEQTEVADFKRGENFQVLNETYRVLKPGGGLLLEIPNRNALLEAVEENPRRLMVMEDCEVHEQFDWDSSRGRLKNKTRFVSGDHEETGSYSIRLYETSEIRELVSAAGFRIRRTFGDYEGGRFGPKSSDILLLHATRPVRKKI